MRILKYLSLWALLISNVALAQRNDNIWLGGYRGYPGNIIIYDTNANNCWGGTSLNFGTHPVAITFDSSQMSYRRSIVSYSDSMGKILFYFNGFQIRNKWDELIYKGDTVNFDTVTYKDSSYYIYGALGPGTGIMALPINNHQDSFMLFYTGTSHNYYDYQFRASLIDMSAHNGHGEVIYRDSVLGSGYMGGAIAACRHANGRDWWVFCQQQTNATIYRVLLQEHGVILVDTLNHGLYIHPYQNEMIGNARFSPDGTKYSYVDIANSVVYLYDFDRCSGLLSNARYWHDSKSFFRFSISHPCFSPDSRFLYVSTDSVIFQFDTHAADVWGSRDTIAVYTNVNEPDSFRSYFGCIQLGPDGKLYVGHGLSSTNYDIIDSPNAKGVACKFIRHGLLAKSQYGGLPNFPNYRLGKSANPCTTGIDEVVNGSIDIHIQPNPAHSIVVVDYGTVDWSHNLSLHLHITDMLGQSVYAYDLSRFSALHQVDVSTFATGVYVITISDMQGRMMGVKKLVKE